MSAQDIVLACGVRTPFGDFGRSLRELPLTRLGEVVARECLRRAGIDAARVDHLVWGNTVPVDHDGLFASRKIALQAGLPVDSGALAVSRACGSGSQAIVSAAQQIASGHSEVALACGGENFSRVPYLSHEMRLGAERGSVPFVDGLEYIYRCPFSGELMGDTAERLAERFGYTREAMDDWALMSQQRAGAAQAGGFLARQIVAVDVPDAGRGKGAMRRFDADEFPRPAITRDKLASLRPAFRKDGRGCVTAGNSSGVTDGAAALLVARREAAQRLGVQAEARLVDHAVVGVPPEIMGAGPVPAVRRLLERNRLAVSDIDYWEINEAFAVVNLHAERELGLPRERTNRYGGGISIGHPPGATGLRMTITAMHHLADSGGRYAVISMCLGSGMGMATLIENERGR
jgi:acetyl-CoA acetyltransferase family protein